MRFFSVSEYDRVLHSFKEVISIATEYSDSYELTDTQSESLDSSEQVALDKVGVRNLEMPLTIQVRGDGTQRVTAEVDLGINLAREQRGAHLSRFIELIEDYRESSFHVDSVGEILRRTSKTQEASKAYADLEFTYFMEKESPLSEKTGLMNFDCGFGGMIRDGELTRWIVAEVPVTSLCPCSKKNSNEGAHNQRALVETKVVIDERVWLEDLIEMIEEQGSSELYSILKRDDEAYVTDQAYDNPKFVEDIVRDLSVEIKNHDKMKDFFVECTSFESIHNHDAYARAIQGDIWQGRYLI